MTEKFTLNPNDPIEAAMIEMVKTNRKKRADYAKDGDIYGNFRLASDQVGISVIQGIDYMVATKQARLQALSANGRPPNNESVLDTYLDRAVYSVIALAYLTQESP